MSCFRGLAAISAALAREIEARFQMLAAKRIHVVHEAASQPPAFKQDYAARGSIRVRYVGNVHPGKGADALERAAGALQ